MAVPFTKGWPTIQKRFDQAKTLLLLLDYDGTLAPIRSHPSKARLPRKTQQVLRQLMKCKHVHLGILSGRSLRDIRKQVGLTQALYGGNHGLELRLGKKQWMEPVARRSVPFLKRLANQLSRHLRSIPGVWVENKGASLTIHWREASQKNVSKARRASLQLLAPLQKEKRIRTTYGKKVMEVRPPVMWGKGKAVTAILKHGRLAKRGLLVFYAGDDLTDEDAFRTVRRKRGITVRIGLKRSTAAQYKVRSVGHFYKVLHQFSYELA